LYCDGTGTVKAVGGMSSFAALAGKALDVLLAGSGGALLSDQPIEAGTVVERAASWRRGARYVRIAEWGPKDSRLAVVDEAGVAL
jgi:hypothetical protein